MRKVEPLGKALRGYSAWVTGIRRVEAPTRANAPLISFDEAFGLVKINPLAAWSDDDMQAYIDENGVLVNPAGRRGLSVDRLRAVHRQAGDGRRPAQRTLGRAWPRPNAGCTPRDARPDRARQRRSAVGGDRRTRSPTRIRRLRPRPRRAGGVLRAELAEPARRAARRRQPVPSWSPLLLADAYHARVDIPAMIAESGCRRAAGRRARRGRPAGARAAAAARRTPGCRDSTPTSG